MNRIKLKFLIFCMALFLGLSAAAFSAEDFGPVPEQLSKIEMSLFNFDYKNESDTKRLDRIEKEVFGVSNSKISIQQRINKINSTLGLESLAEAKAPLSDLYKEEVEGVNYPAVDMLEIKILGKNYKKDNIYKRLERLEKQVFGNTQKGDLAQRTDTLKAQIAMMAPSSSLPSSQGSQYYAQGGGAPYEYGGYTEEDVISKARQDANQRNNTYNYNYGYGGSDASLQVAGLENTLFGHTYSYDPMSVRLNRLERKIFQRDFSSDDEYARLERLQAAATAKKTAKYYEQNKFQKFTSTGVQIGTFVLMILALIL